VLIGLSLSRFDIVKAYTFCSFSLREKVGMRGSIRKMPYFNPLTLALSRRERGLKPLLLKF
jgi:hypothetical protein